MFEHLSEGLQRVVRDLRGHARLNEDILDKSLRDVRLALLEADVAVPVVRQFIDQVRTRAMDREVASSLTPGQMVIKIVREELVRTMGDAAAPLRPGTGAPAVILLAGLQGAGKTTTAVKLAVWLRNEGRKKVTLAGCDVYRPAAMVQLEQLCRQNDLECLEPAAGARPEEIARDALARARSRFAQVLIVDTAGRLHVDEEMMAELRRLYEVLSPSDTLFVVDGMMGQDAARAAAAFSERLPLTGVILSKMDGDARGGAALSVRQVAGAPILFMGTGEKAGDFTVFQPDRVASRILGMGDVLGLIEEVERKTDRRKAEQLARKVRGGKGLDLDDFRDQLRQMRSLGGLAGLLDNLPGAMQIPAAAAQMDESHVKRLEAIICSMTAVERRRPEIINGSRKKRIAAGSGTRIQEVSRLLKQFQQAQKMMKRLKKAGGMDKLLRGRMS
ncbi:MAG: signal recognition particle protein [Gammaproteobacteria bacterium]|nr:signal recognition particle protein [Gammaproteobacteria bacterium]